MVQAHRDKAVEAFERWCRMHGRAKRGSGKHSDAEFYDAVKNSLDLVRDAKPEKLKIPRTRSGWANWRARRSSNVFRERFDVCSAIWMLTEVDITSNGFLSSEPLNATEMITLGPVSIRDSAVSNDKAELVVETITFSMSSVSDIFLSDAKSHPKDSDGAIRIGTVRFLIREASVSVASGRPIEPLVYHASNETCSEGSFLGATFSVDPDEHNRWRVQPTYPAEVLQCRLQNIKLCNLTNSNEVVRVAVSVGQGDVFPDVKLAEPQKISNKQDETVRERLVAQVLRNRIIDQGLRRRFVLSSAPSLRE